MFNDRKRVVGFRFDVEMLIVWFSVWIVGLVCLVQWFSGLVVFSGFSESVCFRHVLIGLVHFSVEAYVRVSCFIC